MFFLPLLTFLLAPTYAVRFDFLGFPINLLMLWVMILWAITIIYFSAKRLWRDFFGFVAKLDKKVLIFTALFFLSGLISLFAKGFNQQKLGQFIVLFLQPISVFLIAGYIANRQPKTKSLLLVTCYMLLMVLGLYALIQYFTLLGLPPIRWGNAEEPRRAISFFSHPNFFALFITPLLAFLIPDVADKLKNWKADIGNLKFIIAWLLGAAGLFFSLSRAGWLGLVAAIAVYLLVAADSKVRKTILSSAVITLIVIAAVPTWRHRLTLPFNGERAANQRIVLWQSGLKAIKGSPVTGLGLTGFAQAWPRLNTDPTIYDTHNYPHNIFLDLWVETGILGLISLAGLIVLYIYRGLRMQFSPPFQGGAPRRRRGEVVEAKDEGLRIKDFALPISLFLIALVSQGLIDNPYFKNDLAMVFWLILSLGI